MNNQFKQLLVKIASLPLSDQRWLLKQLTPKQKRIFTHYKGTSLLYKARRFAKVPLPAIQTLKPNLPHLYYELKNQSPFYAAIILEQGQFAWKEQFIAQYQHALPMDAVKELKSSTKSALFQQWQKSLNFADHLEVEHGSSI